MRILVTGANGQLGRALQRTLDSHSLTLIDLPEVDVTDGPSFSSVFSEAQPDLVIHCAAYTDVDGCARDPELAYRVNALGTWNVALLCQAADLPMVHISTNEVFSGDSLGGYQEWMPLSPRNPYGQSKAAAEFHVRSLLSRYYIVRTAWLYAAGGRNFVHAILRRARENGSVRVVTDEIGNPTYVVDLAVAISRLITTGQYGVYHFVNSGACSRWAFANEILRLSGLSHVPNTPILSRTFSRPSSPPPFGELHNIAGASIGITLRPWAEALSDFLQNEPAL